MSQMRRNLVCYYWHGSIYRHGSKTHLSARKLNRLIFDRVIQKNIRWAFCGTLGSNKLQYKTRTCRFVSTRFVIDNAVKWWLQIRRILSSVRNCSTNETPDNPSRFRAQCAAILHLPSPGKRYDNCRSHWLGSRVVSVLDSGAEGPGFKSQSRRCRVAVLGKLFAPIVPLFTKQQHW